MSILKWLENIWNLRKIFDKYLPKIREILETLQTLQRQIEDLRQAKIDLQKEVTKLKGEVEAVSDSEDKSPVITKVNKYYDPQMGIEYLDFEVNGDKPSSEDDTVVEK